VTAAVVGCTHGELDLIYQDVKKLIRDGTNIDIILCCGDFEAVRNENDLECLSGPKKYHYFKDFKDYFEGKKTAPILTIFVGGNHEAINHLNELYFGGWVCPNIYFLGMTGVVDFAGIRIAGISGIYKDFDYGKGHYETFPYNDTTKRSAFHIKQYEIWKIDKIENPIDIIMSHDWPSRLTPYSVGETNIRNDILQGDSSGTVGCPYFTELIEKKNLNYGYQATCM